MYQTVTTRSTLISGAIWCVHSMGIVFVAASVLLVGMSWWWELLLPTSKAIWIKEDGQRYQVLQLYGDGVLDYTRGVRRAGVEIQFSKVVNTYVEIGESRYANPSLLDVLAAASPDLTADGRPVRESLEVQVRWQFVLAVGLLLTLLPLLIRPFRQSASLFYRILAYPLAAAASKITGRPLNDVRRRRGFEVRLKGDHDATREEA